MTRNTCLIGTPGLTQIPYKADSPVLVPLAKRDRAREALARFAGRESLEDRLRAEYRGVVRSLLAAGASIYALNLDEGDPRLARFLRRRSVRSLRFVAREDTRWQLFPRDMFLTVERARTLLVHRSLFRLRRSSADGYRVIHSPWAEGGRVLLSGNRLVIGHHPEARPSRAGALTHLARRGMKVASVPLPIIAELGRVSGHVQALRYDQHIDRSAALVRARDGSHHLILTPDYRTGPLATPLSATDSADAVRRACSRIGVAVHQPATVSLPYGAAAVQLESGHVLVSAQERVVRALLGGLVGVERVVPVRPGLLAYPVFAAAGLHCLVTELPTPLVRGVASRVAK